MKPMQLFLRWEIDLHLNYLHRQLSDFAHNVEAYNQAVLTQLPLTVNEFRKAAGPNVLAHPDDRGEVFVYTDNEDRPGDDAIPPGYLIGAWIEILTKESTIVQGKRTRDQLIAKYQKLFDAASAAADELGIDLP